MKRLALISGVVLIAGTLAADTRTPITGPVKVTDGDTLDYSIRLFGIDTPERDQLCRLRDGTCYPCGRAATSHLKILTLNKAVRCEPTGKITYGRMVAVCYAGDKDLSKALLRDGWAVAYRRFLDEVPSLKDAYLVAESRARAARRGLWRGNFVMPKDWRRGARLTGCEG